MSHLIITVKKFVGLILITGYIFTSCLSLKALNDMWNWT